jgi:hypothetical protein
MLAMGYLMGWKLEYQTLLIDDEPSKALQIPKWSGFFFFFESFWGEILSKNKM